MGYSGRYHAASLAAVFIALAVGILIGIGLADDVVSSASEELEASLRSDLKAAQGEAEELRGALERSDKFG
ncbi:MAG: copper transporter, partial [Acidobacteria bacterium]